SSARQTTTTACALTFGIALLGIPAIMEMFSALTNYNYLFSRPEYNQWCGILSPFFLIANYGSGNNQWQGDVWWSLLFLQALWMIPGSILLQTLTQRNIRRID
ncbi:MAG: hypothetical protein GY869_17050, partial [Planctomycetes bacterium]|nr:hypothetical protein [Planctomycetota bacterium]